MKKRKRGKPESDDVSSDDGRPAGDTDAADDGVHESADEAAEDIAEVAAEEGDDHEDAASDEAPDEVQSPTAPGSEEQTSPPMTRESSITTALASSVVTGAGHWLIRRYRRALWFFLPAGIVIVGGMLYAVVQGRTELAVKTVQLPWLWTFLAINLALLGFRLAATTDAWRLGKRPTDRTWMGMVGLVVALVITAAPHLFIASYNVTWIDTLQEVFDAPATTATTDPDAFAGPVLSTTTTAAETTTTSTTNPRIIGVPDFDLPPNTIPVSEFLDLEGMTDGRYLSVLLAGGDAGPGRGGLRTDTMIVATLDLETNRAYLFGLSRELVHIPIPSGFRKAFYDLEDRLWEIELKDWIRDQDKRCVRSNGEWKKNPPDFCPELIEQPEHCDCFPDRLNAIYTYTRNWTNTWPDVPDPGMEALRQSMERLMGIPIDYYVLVDMAGFVGLVDALGGVDIWVYEAVHQGFSAAVEGGPIVRVDVEPGYQHLDGNQALAYVRDRAVVGDSGRVRRQRCMVRSVAAAADPMDILWNFPAIAEAIRENTTTNIPLEFLPELVRSTSSLSLDDIVTVSLTGSYYHDGRDWRDIPMPDIGHIRWRVKAILEGTAEGSSEGDTNECGDPEAITDLDPGE